LTPQTLVIAIAGTSGAGKSTLIEELVGRLGNANALSLDDYESSSVYPPVREWLEGGADPNQFQTPQFVAAAMALQEGKSIIHPLTGQVLRPAPYLLLEEPFGRARAGMKDLIDFLVYVDIPLEVAHARKLSRKNDFFPWEDNPQVFIQNLRDHLSWYLTFGRDFYFAVKTMAIKDCDLVVDGRLSTEQIADQVIEALKRR
jgi:uridine kinase